MDSNILSKWKKDYENDETRGDYSLPQGVNEDIFTADEKMRYKVELDNLRTEMSFEAQYKKAMDEIIRMDETEMKSKKLIENENIKSVKVIHAVCPECGAELVSKFPPMFNPYTQERQCIHHCVCGKKYNLEYAYPRLAFYNENDEEVFAHCE